MEIFSELDHRLSVVKRWGILHTIQTQSVAEHVHNVQRIALRIAINWFDIEDEKELYWLMRWALEHDDLEALTGDLPAMVKPYFDEEAVAMEHLDVGFDAIQPSSNVLRIVKLADKLEGYHFLAMEMKLGNQYVANHHAEEWGIIEKYITSTFDKDRVRGVLNGAWEFMRWCNTSISTRHSKRGK